MGRSRGSILEQLYDDTPATVLRRELQRLRREGWQFWLAWDQAVECAAHHPNWREWREVVKGEQPAWRDAYYAISFELARERAPLAGVGLVE